MFGSTVQVAARGQDGTLRFTVGLADGLTSTNRGPNGRLDPKLTRVTCGGCVLDAVASYVSLVATRTDLALKLF